VARVCLVQLEHSRTQRKLPQESVHNVVFVQKLLIVHSVGATQLDRV